MFRSFACKKDPWDFPWQRVNCHPIQQRAFRERSDENDDQTICDRVAVQLLMVLQLAGK
jgi:hypothetical protein